MMNAKKRCKAGPKEARLVIEGDWKDALKKAVGRKRPAGGWPKAEKKPKKS